MSESNLALDALRKVHEGIDDRIPFTLIEACYRVEKKHQFTERRDIPLSELRQVIGEYVDKKHEQQGSEL